MKREKVYIAGPVTGIERKTVINAFTTWENYLLTLGYEVINPVKIVEPDTEWQEAMYICLFYLAQSDKALFMQNWIYSKGASVEMEFCIKNGITLLSRGLIESAYFNKVYKKIL